MSRRVMKSTASTTNTFLYDGWNLIHEEMEAATPTSRSYVWGLDLSGTLQGAGGVGGLLARVREENIPRPLYYAGDANGNVTDVLDQDGDAAAHYEYDGFGNAIARSGTQADANSFRFSSKYCDGETGLYYYGYRYYSPDMGRWPNRDSIGEAGGKNLYWFVGNQPVDRVDILGLRQWPWQGCCDGQTYNRFTKCCCCNGQTIRNGGAGCKILEKKEIETGVVTHKWTGISTPDGTPMHQWIVWDGGSADANATAIFSQPGDGIVRSPALGVMTPNTATLLKLSPCEYDFKKLNTCLTRIAGEKNGQYFGYCDDFVSFMISTCKAESKGCTMP